MRTSLGLQSSAERFMCFAFPQPKRYSQYFMPFALPPNPVQQHSDFEAADDSLLIEVFGKEQDALVRHSPLPAPAALQPPSNAQLPDPNPTGVTQFREEYPQPEEQKEAFTEADSAPRRSVSTAESEGEKVESVRPLKGSVARTQGCEHLELRLEYTCPAPCSYCVLCLKKYIAMQPQHYKKCYCGRILGGCEMRKIVDIC